MSFWFGFVGNCTIVCSSLKMFFWKYCSERKPIKNHLDFLEEKKPCLKDDQIKRKVLS